MQVEPIQIPEQLVPIARQLWRCLRGELGPWEVVFDGKLLSIRSAVAPEWASGISIECGQSLLRFLRGDSALKYGEHSFKILRPCLGILASDTLTHDDNAVIPQFYVIAPRVTDPIAHHISADDDGNFTIKLRTRLIGAPVEARILL